jgi:hypothetical protein
LTALWPSASSCSWCDREDRRCPSRRLTGHDPSLQPELIDQLVPAPVERSFAVAAEMIIFCAHRDFLSPVRLIFMRSREL